MRAAQDGLMPDGREAVLNIYNTKVKVQGGCEEWVPMVQYLPMVRGILKVVRNSGEIVDIDAAAVYERDHFKFVRGDEACIEHEPYLGDDEPGKIIAAYMIVKLANGEVHREVMPRRDIEKVRAASKSPNGPMWRDWYDQGAIKSVIKRGAKLLPNSSERLDRVIEHDNEAMGFEGFNQRGADASAVLVPPETPTAAPAAPALTDQRLDQDMRRPSRMAGIVSRARQAQPAAAGLPPDHAPLEAAE
jgi:recombination protein RecT